MDHDRRRESQGKTRMPRLLTEHHAGLTCRMEKQLYERSHHIVYYYCLFSITSAVGRRGALLCRLSSALKLRRKNCSAQSRVVSTQRKPHWRAFATRSYAHAAVEHVQLCPLPYRPVHSSRLLLPVTRRSPRTSSCATQITLHPPDCNPQTALKKRPTLLTNTVPDCARPLRIETARLRSIALQACTNKLAPHVHSTVAFLTSHECHRLPQTMSTFLLHLQPAIPMMIPTPI